jgi:hypothetical protein
MLHYEREKSAHLCRRDRRIKPYKMRSQHKRMDPKTGPFQNIKEFELLIIYKFRRGVSKDKTNDLFLLCISMVTNDFQS